MLKAESGLNPKAARYGEWPDVSFGYSQLTVQTAKGYGVGTGENTPENIDAVRQILFDRHISIDLGAYHLSDCYGQADALGYQRWMISHDLGALIIYNAGTLPSYSDPWWTRWANNVASYERALAWAKEVIG